MITVQWGIAALLLGGLTGTQASEFFLLKIPFRAGVGHGVLDTSIVPPYLTEGDVFSNPCPRPHTEDRCASMALSLLTKHVLHTWAVSSVICDMIEKVAEISNLQFQRIFF